MCRQASSLNDHYLGSMAISMKTRMVLWGLSGGRCAFSGCAEILVRQVGGGGTSLVGEIAHIVSREMGGPRGSEALDEEERASLPNLILLCGYHHKIVDDHPARYTVVGLREMKRVHEARMLAVEDEEARQLRLVKEFYADVVDVWAAGADLDDWTYWTSGLLSHVEPSMQAVRFEALQQLRPWLLSRVWPGRYPALEASFENFRSVLDDLVEAFDAGVRPTEGEILWTHRWYKDLGEWNPRLYHRRLDGYRRHVALVENLGYELTRAANYVCDQVRSSLDPGFRRVEGALLMQRGPSRDEGIPKCRPEYRDAERTLMPYSGGRQFERVGPARDFWVRHQDL